MPPNTPNTKQQAPNIWQMQIGRDVDGLIAALRHPESTVRRGAVAALRALSAWQAVPALEAQMAVESDWQVHAAISSALQYLDHDIHIETMIKNRDVRGLLKMLNSPRPEDIAIACDALANIGDKQAAEPLIMVFRNVALSSKVRLAAAEALIKLESAPAVVTLLAALRRNDPAVRRNAAAVLGQLKAAWAVEPLIKTLADPVSAVARTAAAALRNIGTTEALLAFRKFEERLRATDTQTRRTPTNRLSGTGQLPAQRTDGKPATSPLREGAPRPSTNPLNRPSVMNKPATGKLPTTAPAAAPAPIPTASTAPTNPIPPTAPLVEAAVAAGVPASVVKKDRTKELPPLDPPKPEGSDTKRVPTITLMEKRQQGNDSGNS